MSEQFNNFKNDFVEHVKKREQLIEKLESRNNFFFHIISDPTEFPSRMKHPRLGNNNLKTLDELFPRCQNDDQQLFSNHRREPHAEMQQTLVHMKCTNSSTLSIRKSSGKYLKRNHFLATKTSFLHQSKKSLDETMSTEHFASIGLEAYHIPNIDLNALTQKLESLYKEV